MAAPDDPILARLRGVRAEIDAAAIAAGRQPSEVKLLLATKTQPADRIITALTAGYRLIGENRVQEVVAKAEELSPFSPETHFIGHLQANKINQLVDHISCLQTLDTVDLARKLDSRLDSTGATARRADPGQRVRRDREERRTRRSGRSTCSTPWWPFRG